MERVGNGVEDVRALLILSIKRRWRRWLSKSDAVRACSSFTGPWFFADVSQSYID